MIHVSIELWPKGDFRRKIRVGELFISNDCSGSSSVGNYRVRLMKSSKFSRAGGIWKAGEVKGFSRLVLGPYDLLYRALKAVVGSRN